MNNLQELIILSAPGVPKEYMREMADAINQAGFPGVMITNEEFKVVDLDKLEKQLQSLLHLVKQIKNEKQEVEYGESPLESILRKIATTDDDKPLTTFPKIEPNFFEKDKENRKQLTLDDMMNKAVRKTVKRIEEEIISSLDINTQEENEQ